MKNTSATQPKTETERAYQTLRTDIVSGRLAAGYKLKVLALKQEYEVGAAPLREALARLVGDRLVYQHGQRGFYVVETTQADAEEVGHLRVMLECEALSNAIQNGDDAWEAGVVATYHRLSLVESRQPAVLTEIEARNGDFHDAIIAACRSRRLIDLRSQVYLHHERYRHLSRSSPDGSRGTAAEHASLYQAVIDRDPVAACSLLTSHIDRTTQRAIMAL